MTCLYNGDVKTDLLWRNTGNNQLAVWELDGTQLQPGTDFPSDQRSRSFWFKNSSKPESLSRLELR